jgi:hypothetical protein
MLIYRIVEGRNLIDLENQINKMIKNGWKPQGGVMIAPPTYIQAMVTQNDRKE